MGQYVIGLAKLAGVKTLNVVCREEAAEQVRQWGGDRVVLQGDKLHKNIEEALVGAMALAGAVSDEALSREILNTVAELLKAG